MDTRDYKSIVGDGFVYAGSVGTGKTTKLIELVLKAENPIILSFTNKAMVNIKYRLQKVYEQGKSQFAFQGGFTFEAKDSKEEEQAKSEEWAKFEIRNMELDKQCYTFESYFCDYLGTDITDLEGKTIFIEEHSMVPNKWIVKINEAFTKYRSTVYMFGDTNQCDPVAGDSQIHYEYINSITIKEMHPERQYLEYIEDSSRYDKKKYNILKKFLRTGTVKNKFSAIGQYYKNICYLNKTRRRVTKECSDRYVQEKDSVEVHLLRYIMVLWNVTT